MFKKIIQRIVLVITFSIFALPLLAGDYQIEDQPLVLEKVIQLEQKGILKQKENGYLYLDVSNDYIREALPLLEIPGKIVPPSHFSTKKGIGAHISVMYETEQIVNDIWEIKELGQEFTFTILEVRTVKINKNNQMKKLWLIAVDAPELQLLRESYGLSPKLKNHDFHITIGSQVPGKVQKVLFEEMEQEREAA
jgi:hypothetical protein